MLAEFTSAFFGEATYRWNDFPPLDTYDRFFVAEDGIELAMNSGDRRKYLFADATRTPATPLPRTMTLTLEAPPTSP